MTEPAVRTDDLWKVFSHHGVTVEAVRGVTINIVPGEFVVLAGPSGSGKTTLLNMLGGLSLPTRGTVWLDGHDLTGMSDHQLADLRLHRLGFVFQAYNLLPVLTALENAEFSLLLQGVPAAERRRRVSELFRTLGIDGLEDRLPGALSGGQQQRVAVARAVAGSPALVLADEPTANLDSVASTALIDLMARLNHDLGTTFVFATHDDDLMRRARRLIRLVDGRSRRRRTAPLMCRPTLLAALALLPAALPAQALHPSAYLLNVGLYTAALDGRPAAAYDLQRVRLMAAPVWRRWSADLAYEQFLVLQTASPGALAGALGQPSSADWLPLQGSFVTGDHVTWRQRVDRLAVHYTTSRVEIIAGRQPISWATTLLLTPADPFAPFDPSDPFREYRAGVDAVRVRAFPGPFADVEAALRVADTPEGRRLTGGVRGKVSRGAAEWSAWAGAVYGDPAAAIGATWTVAGAAVRGEAELRRNGDSTVVRGTVGIDRNFTLAGRSLYVAAEYQYDGFGAADAAQLPAVAAGPVARRGELQVAGRHEAALHLTWQLHPLVALDALTLVDLGDGSVLAAPAASWSASSRLTVRAGLYAGFGANSGPAAVPASEYGAVPTSFYLSAALYY